MEISLLAELAQGAGDGLAVVQAWRPLLVSQHRGKTEAALIQVVADLVGSSRSKTPQAGATSRPGRCGRRPAGQSGVLPADATGRRALGSLWVRRKNEEPVGSRAGRIARR